MDDSWMMNGRWMEGHSLFFFPNLFFMWSFKWLVICVSVNVCVYLCLVVFTANEAPNFSFLRTK